MRAPIDTHLVSDLAPGVRLCAPRVLQDHTLRGPQVQVVVKHIVGAYLRRGYGPV